MDQRDWRFCTKCFSLFYNGFDFKGRCPKDGDSHTALGFNFEPHFHPDIDLPDTATTQSKWRFCNKCHVMFWAGSSNADRRCAADGGPHVEQGFHFMLPVNRLGGPVLVPETPTGQSNWRFCGKCTSIFFNGYPDKGVCPRDGSGHLAVGDTLVLPHDTHPSIDLADEGFQVRIAGNDFVPNERVFITYQFTVTLSFPDDDRDKSISFTQGSGETRTDNDGRFRDFIFNLPEGEWSHADDIGVLAKDAFTSLWSSGQLRWRLSEKEQDRGKDA